MLNSFWDAFWNSKNSVVKSKTEADPDLSYTAKLLQSSVERTAQKIGEEGLEVALAAATHNKEQVINESADLVYHLIVLLEKLDIPLSDVVSELSERNSK